MKTYKIILSENELKELAIYTSVYTDLKLGKIEEIANKGFSYFTYNLKFELLEGFFDKIKKIEFPSLSKKDFIKDLTSELKIVDFVSQSLKYTYALGKHPQGGVTRWFNKPKNITETVSLNIKKTRG